MTNALATTLLYNPDPMARRTAAQDLGQGGCASSELSSVVDSLVGALSDPYIAVQQAAANALLEYEPQSVSERILPLLHGSVQHRSIAVDILQQLGSASVA
ncbi:MAG: HEAT repeat domain-containing protein, partial [Nitrospirota bacterium]|nr:HEAT repeat domain-containing protein [Nitrospirota bacterium]